ncbi:MAG: DinB family protein [Proteobacteria bacterium]|nr:DinB family protein [Pseudomonadota bacterium]
MQDIRDLLEGLKRTPGILSSFVKSIPESRMDLRRGEGFWTIAEHVSHLAEVQPMLLERFQRFLNEDHPQFIPFNPGKDEPVTPVCMSPTAALLQFEQYRKKQLMLLENAGTQIWQRTATHPEYDQYSFYILARHVLMHDYWHMYRIEELWLTRDGYLTRLE